MNQSTPTPYRRGRQTIYRGVKMRSRTEARFAATLDDAGIPWKYEPMALASQDGQWLPDFEITHSPVRTFVDVKSTLNEAIDGVEGWYRIADAALPGERVRVVSGGYNGARVWIEKQIRCAGVDNGPRPPAVEKILATHIEVVEWSPWRGVAVYGHLTGGDIDRCEMFDIKIFDAFTRVGTID